MRESQLRRYVEALVPLSTLALALMPLLPMRLTVALTAFWITTLVARALLDPTPIRQDAWRWTLLLALPLGLMLLDTFRAPTLWAGWQHNERGMAFLVFPVGYLLLGAPASDRFREAMMDLFSLCAVLLAVYVNGRMLTHGFSTEAAGVIEFDHAYRISFSAYTLLHPPYGSYFFISAALFQLDRTLDQARRPWWRVFAIGILFLAALLLASRMPLMAFAAGASVILFLRLPRHVAMRSALGTFLGVALLAAVVPGVRERAAEALSTMRGKPSPSELNSVNIRVPIAHCSLALIKDHWAVGVGQSRAQRELDMCYQQFKQPALLDGSYGTHNQLLHWWLSFGLAGLVLYVIYFGTLIITAWQRRDAVHAGFLVFMLLCMTTENVLNRQWGLLLFACFNTLFVAGGPTLQAARSEGPTS